MTLSRYRVGYVPYQSDLSAPGDRRRFPRYAQERGLAIEEPRRTETYDLIYLSSRADIVAWAKYKGTGKVVFELIDSYLALSSKDPRSALRGIGKFAIHELSRPILNYRRAIEKMARRADAVVCSTEEQRRDLLELCPNVHVILDFHDEIGSKTKQTYEREETFKLVWEGLPENLVGFRSIGPALDALRSRLRVSLHLVTGLHYYRYLGRLLRRDTRKLLSGIEGVHIHPWDLQTFAQVVTDCDVAVIPIDLNDRFAAGKPENKLLIFWRLGMPVVTSATPAYERAMRASGVNLHCTTTDEWIDTLSDLAESEPTRRDSGSKGRAHVERFHSKEILLEKWDALLDSLG